MEKISCFIKNHLRMSIIVLLVTAGAVFLLRSSAQWEKKNQGVEFVQELKQARSSKNQVTSNSKHSPGETPEGKLDKNRSTPENMQSPRKASDETNLPLVGECLLFTDPPKPGEYPFRDPAFYDPAKPPSYYQHEGWEWSFEEGQWYFRPAKIPPHPPHNRNNPPPYGPHDPNYPNFPPVMSIDKWVWRGTYWAITD